MFQMIMKVHPKVSIILTDIVKLGPRSFYLQRLLKIRKEAESMVNKELSSHNKIALTTYTSVHYSIWNTFERVAFFVQNGNFPIGLFPVGLAEKYALQEILEQIHTSPFHAEKFGCGKIIVMENRINIPLTSELTSDEMYDLFYHVSRIDMFLVGSFNVISMNMEYDIEVSIRFKSLEYKNDFFEKKGTNFNDFVVDNSKNNDNSIYMLLKKDNICLSDLTKYITYIAKRFKIKNE